MDPMNEALDFILERARGTKEVMVRLAAAPYNWMWDGVSPNNFGNQIDAVDEQFAVLIQADAATRNAAALWDYDLDLLLADVALGIRMARVKFKDSPPRLTMFEILGNLSNGRDARATEALKFKEAWKLADPAWVFKSTPAPALTLALFTQRVEAISPRKGAHVVADMNEQFQRVHLHNLADAVNAVSVDWYEVATANFAEATVQGQLVRTVPTTYNPNRAPGPLIFTTRISVAPNQVNLTWQAPRGQRFFILGKRPGGTGFEIILDGVPGKEWVGLGLTPGVWTFKGYATNQFGQGTESETIQIDVAAAAAA